MLRSARVVGQYLPDRVKSRFGVDHEDGDVDYIVEGTARSCRDIIQVSAAGHPILIPREWHRQHGRPWNAGHGVGGRSPTSKVASRDVELHAVTCVASDKETDHGSA